MTIPLQMNLSIGHYNDHVAMLPGPVHWIICDKVLSTLLIIFSILGVLGNSAACTYFQSNDKRGLAPRLYTMICVVDIATSLTSFPVAVSLFAERKPVLFNNKTFCTIWNIVFRYVQIMSMYLVLLLSITRCILIAFPFHSIRKQWVLVSIVIYTAYLMLKNLVVAVTPSLNLISQYSSDVAYCYDWFGENGTRTGMMIKYVAFIVESGVPPILTFISFIITVYKISNGNESDSIVSQIKRKTVSLFLLGRKCWKRAGDAPPPRRWGFGSNHLTTSAVKADIDIRLLRLRDKNDKFKVAKRANKAKEKRKASVTVAIFTTIFLLCNLPFFIVVLKDIVGLNNYYEGVEGTSPSDAALNLYVAGYAWILSRLHFTVLNAMLNPIMYCFRMDGFKLWLSNKFSRKEQPYVGVGFKGTSLVGLLTCSRSQSRESRILRRNITI